MPPSTPSSKRQTFAQVNLTWIKATQLPSWQKSALPSIAGLVFMTARFFLWQGDVRTLPCRDGELFFDDGFVFANFSFCDVSPAIED